MVEIYCDGSCRGNGKAENTGGFGVLGVITSKEMDSYLQPVIEYKYNEQVENTTNNRMELQALIHALELTQTRYKGQDCVIYCDSAYCTNMINEWIYSWHNRGWKRAGNKDIENLDLVLKIWEYLKIEFSNFHICKVKGHEGEVGNELADALATGNEAKFVKILKENEDWCAFEEIFDFPEKL